MPRLIVFILSIASYAPIALSVSNDECIGYQRLKANRISFFHYTKPESAQRHYYVLAITDNTISERNFDVIITNGSPLILVSQTHKPIYKIPAHSKKLFVLVSKNEIPGVSKVAQVTPDVFDPDDAAKRNVEPIITALTPETIDSPKVSIDSLLCYYKIDINQP